MRLTPRLGLRLVLVLAAVVIVCIRLIPRHQTRPASSVPDLSATNPLNQSGGGPAPAEAYEVYSAIYQVPSQTPSQASNQPPADEPLVFAAQSRTDIPQVGGSCLKPTTPAENEMTEDFVAANQQSHLWDQKFTIPQGYKLLSPADTAQAQACLASHDQTSSRCAAWKQVRHVRFLGVPGFDRAHTHALVSVIKSCGGFCGSGGIFEVEKAGNTWRRSEPTSLTSDCSWTY
jgi:uncharacterized protein YbdZ (MbtH family)